MQDDGSDTIHAMPKPTYLDRVAAEGDADDLSALTTDQLRVRVRDLEAQLAASVWAAHGQEIRDLKVRASVHVDLMADLNRRVVALEAHAPGVQGDAPYEALR